MSKFTFVCQEESMPFVHSTQSKRTVEFNAETLDDILNEFEMFLRGAGFHFNGQLDIVNVDEWNEDSDGIEEFETPQFQFDEEKIKKRWDATIQSMMNPPKFRANEEKVEIGVNSYGAAQPTISFPPGVDTITLTGLQPGGSLGISCEICGLPRNTMKSHNCYDDNCPKGTWK